jgi:hypothetical protein
MRRLIGITAISLLAIAFLAGAPGCKRKPKKVQVEATEETNTSLATMVHVADPRASVQLVKGFHDVEQNAWRWTMQKFSVTLRPPAGAAQRGALLRVQFAVPDPVLAKLKSIRLTANVEGVPLEGQEYTKPGEQVYSVDVPAKALGGEAVIVDFALDKALMPSASDERELGIVVSTIGFEAK